MTNLSSLHTKTNKLILQRLLPAILMACVALLAGPHVAAAQDDGAATAPAVEEPAAPATAAGAVSANEVNDVARELWCPLCSGVRLDACELKACAQMKDVIGQKLAEGEDVTSIKSYFVAQYGPQVLGEPPMEGFNWLAWILPVLAMAAGGLFVWSRVRSSTRHAQTAVTAGASTASAGDPYSQKLEEELKHYD